MRFLEAYFGGIFNMVIGTGIILGASAVIADYINTKMKVKELHGRKAQAQRRQNRMNNKRLLEGILVIMRDCWDLPTDLKPGELEGFAAELLKRIQAGDSKMALDGYLSNVQVHNLLLPLSNAYSEIVNRATALVKS